MKFGEAAARRSFYLRMEKTEMQVPPMPPDTMFDSKTDCHHTSARFFWLIEPGTGFGDFVYWSPPCPPGPPQSNVPSRLTVVF